MTETCYHCGKETETQIYHHEDGRISLLCNECVEWEEEEE